MINKKIATLTAAVCLALSGMTACNSNYRTNEKVARATGTDYDLARVIEPKVCETKPEMKLEGRDLLPVLYCNDKIGRQVACRPGDSKNGIDAKCYFLDFSN